MVSIRMGEQPNSRITMRNVLKTRDLAVVLLLDLSESTNEAMRGSDKTVLQLTREAATLVSTAIEGIGDPFAIHGFASDGRHDVQYYRFKDFNQHFDDDAKSRLAGMKGGLSTRMGAALRHAGNHLLRQHIGGTGPDFLGIVTGQFAIDFMCHFDNTDLFTYLTLAGGHIVKFGFPGEFFKFPDITIVITIRNSNTL